METSRESTATGKRGRPRDPSRDRAILDAARQVIAQDGYTGATMEKIAKRAGVGKDTLYRRWSSKELLVIDLVTTVADESVRPKPLDPDPRLNLFMFLKEINQLVHTTDFGALVAGIVGEAARNEDLADCFQDFWSHRRAIAAELVRDVVGHEVDNVRIEKLLDNLLAPLYYRLLLTGTATTDEDLWILVAALPWTTGPIDLSEPESHPSDFDADFTTALISPTQPGQADQ